jgi:hypothetical protein
MYANKFDRRARERESKYYICCCSFALKTLPPPQQRHIFIQVIIIIHHIFKQRERERSAAHIQVLKFSFVYKWRGEQKNLIQIKSEGRPHADFEAWDIRNGSCHSKNK